MSPIPGTPGKAFTVARSHVLVDAATFLSQKALVHVFFKKEGNLFTMLLFITCFSVLLLNQSQTLICSTKRQSN